MLRAASVCLLLTLAACQTAWRPPEPTARKFRLPVIEGEATPERIRLIEEALACLAPTVSDSVRVVEINSDVEHFRRRYAETIPIGHHCPKDDRKICVRPAYLSEKLIWHEATHVYAHNVYDYYKSYEGFYFYKTWETAGGDVYGEVYVDPESEGVLTAYARRNVGEDIAEWVEECLAYLYLEKGKSALTKNKYLKTDKRYLRKFELLRSYGFLTELQYERLKPLFK